jgi:hypothetical protein
MHTDQTFLMSADVETIPETKLTNPISAEDPPLGTGDEHPNDDVPQKKPKHCWRKWQVAEEENQDEEQKGNTSCDKRKGVGSKGKC